MLRAISNNTDFISLKLTNAGTILMLYYNGEIKIKEQFEDEKLVKYLAKGSDFVDFFEDPNNAYKDNLIDYYLNGNKLTLIFAEGERRFVVCAHLITKETKKLAEWYV